MPLNGPIQSDGQELKAAGTQKPLGSREGSSLDFAHGKGGHPTTKSSVKTSLWVFNDTPPQPPTAEKCPTPTIATKGLEQSKEKLQKFTSNRQAKRHRSFKCVSR